MSTRSSLRPTRRYTVNVHFANGDDVTTYGRGLTRAEAIADAISTASTLYRIAAPVQTATIAR